MDALAFLDRPQASASSTQSSPQRIMFVSHSIAINPTVQPTTSQAYRDWIGVAASLLCAIHCAAMPFVVGFLPLLGLSFLADPSFHKWMVGVCLALALVAFVPGWRRHHRLAPAMTRATGETSCAAECCPVEDNAIAAANSEGLMSLFWLLMTPLGGVILVVAHLTNHRLDCRCKSNNCPHAQGKQATT